MGTPPPPPPPPPGWAPGPSPGWAPGPWGGPGQLPVAKPAGPRGRRRTWWIVWGVLLFTVGLVGVIGGAVAAMVSRGAQTIDPIAEGVTPGSTTFDADEQEYEILIARKRRSGQARVAADEVVCDVVLGDGSTVRVDGNADLSSAQIGNTESVGIFDAVAGTTSVTCVAEDDQDIRFIIDEPSDVTRVAMWVIGGSVIVLLAGLALFLLGIFWRRPVRA